MNRFFYFIGRRYMRTCAVLIKKNKGTMLALLLISLCTLALCDKSTQFVDSGTAITPTASYFTIEQFVSVGDINGDGITDIVFTSGDSLSLRLGTTEDFADAVEIKKLSNGHIGVQPLLLDIDDDGTLDLVYLDVVRGDSVSIRSGLNSYGNGTFSWDAYPLAVVDDECGQDFRIAVTDFDKDGLVDILYPCGREHLGWFKNRDNLTFELQEFINITYCYKPRDVFVDVNGDGVLDLVRTGDNCSETEVFESTGDGTLLDGVVLNRCRDAFAFADVNNDGDVDLLGSIDSVLESSALVYGVFTNDSVVYRLHDAYPNHPESLFVFDNRPVLTHDFDGDGDLDMLIGSFPSLIFAENDGHGVFSFSTEHEYDNNYAFPFSAFAQFILFTKGDKGVVLVVLPTGETRLVTPGPYVPKPTTTATPSGTASTTMTSAAVSLVPSLLYLVAVAI